jgi:hypothetical protein
MKMNYGLPFYTINKMYELHVDFYERSRFVTGDLVVGWGLV